MRWHWLLTSATVVLASVSASAGGSSISRVWLDASGAYHDIVVAIHPEFVPRNCTGFIENFKTVVNSFSGDLWRATGGRVHVGEVGVVMPPTLAQTCHITPNTQATWQRWANADLRLQEDSSAEAEAYSPIGSIGVGVHQAEGCGRPGHRITLNAEVISNAQNAEELHTIGRSLVAGWSRYRWGVFEERGYNGHNLFPAHHVRDARPAPTFCLPTNATGHWENSLGECESEDIGDCRWKPDETQQLNSSLLYNIAIPKIWSFCDAANHDPESPTPQNLLCEGRSSWEIMQMHPDFSQPQTETPAPQPSTTIRSIGRTTARTTGRTPEIDANGKGASSSSSSSSSSVRYNWDMLENHNIRLKSQPVSTSSSSTTTTTSRTVEEKPTELGAISNNSEELNESMGTIGEIFNEKSQENNKNTTERLYLNDVPKYKPNDSMNENSTSKANNLPAENNKEIKPRRKRESSNSQHSIPIAMRPSLVGAHIIRPSVTDPMTVDAQFPSGHPAAESLVDPREQETNIAKLIETKGGAEAEEKLQDDYSDLPPAPKITFLSPAPKAVVLAIDLSESSVKQVDMDEIRGGVHRWLWGLGSDIRVGLLATYNNDSYPISLGPLHSAPATESELEDELALLPSKVEADSGAYGGRFCLECIIKETVKMLKGGGIAMEAGVLLLAACHPQLNALDAAMVARSGLTVHTLALCSSADTYFDRLALHGRSWVVSGPSNKEHNENGGLQHAEHEVAKVLSTMTQETIKNPNEQILQRITGQSMRIMADQVSGEGPYSSISGKFSVKSGQRDRLLVIVMQHNAKVVEVADKAGKEIDLFRETNKRFWAPINRKGGELSYTLKFLSSSISFPFIVRIDVYETKENNKGVEVKLFTNTDSNQSLAPSSPPLIVWAEVTKDGHPVIGAEVVLTVSHLSIEGSTDMKINLLDNGNADPDIRGHDGVYSRYVTWLPGEGRYALTATASDNHGSASTLTYRTKDGERIPVSTGQFTVITASTTITVARVTSLDYIPPSRVTDLSVTHIQDKVVKLTWSAPGGDLDQGSALEYELKMYTERSAFKKESSFNSSAIAVYCINDDIQTPLQNPASYGTPEHCITELPFTNSRWYFAIRAIDASYNTGRISNVVSAFVPEVTTTETTMSPYETTVGTFSNVTNVLEDKELTTNSTQLSVAGNGMDWRVLTAVGVSVGGLILAGVVVLLCICCCRRQDDSKDPNRPIYKIYVNNAYIQEEDGEIKVVSNGKLTDEKEHGKVPKVQEWVNSLSKYGSSGDMYDQNNVNVISNPNETPMMEVRQPAPVKFPSPVRFGIRTNGSINMRDKSTLSSNSSSKPSDASTPEDFKYQDFSETTSDSTTDGGTSASTATTAELPPPPPHLLEDVPDLPPPYSKKSLPPVPPPKPKSAMNNQSILLNNRNHNNGYTSDEDGGFRPRNLPGVGENRYNQNQFCSFRYLPHPTECSTGGAPDLVDCHSITNGHSTLPHGTVRSVKKRRHISFV